MSYHNSNNNSTGKITTKGNPNSAGTQQSLYIDDKTVGIKETNNIDQSYINTLQIELPSTVINKSFGKDEDYIELHVYNNADQLVFSENNFQDFTIDNSNMLIVDPELILKNRGYISGQYVLKIYLFKNKIFNSSEYPFYIKEISTSRREIKSISPDIENQLFGSSITSFILELESAA